MKVLLVGNYIADQQQSMLLFGQLLQKELSKNEIQIELWQPKKILSFGATGSLFQKYSAYIDKFVFGGIYLFWKRMIGRYDAYHVLDHGNAIYAFFLPSDRTLITCHDCIAIEEALNNRTGEKVGRFGRVLQKLIVRGLKKAKLVCSVSEATKCDLLRLTEINQEQIAVVYNAAYSNVCKKTDEEVDFLFEKYQLPIQEKYFFSLGSNLIRKNRIGIVKGYIRFREVHADSQIKLWIGGKPISDDLNAFIRKSSFATDIRYLGYVDEELLSALYSGCELFVFPSIDEGFGVPIIEAQICNSIVLTSDKVPMSEVAGKSAILVDPLSINSIANGFECSQNEIEIKKIKEEMIRNVSRFSKETMVNNYLGLYQKVTLQCSKRG